MNLIAEIDAFLRRSRMPCTRFGRNALGDPNLVEDLRAGRRVRPVTDARIRAYLRSPEAQAECNR